METSHWVMFLNGMTIGVLIGYVLMGIALRK